MAARLFHGAFAVTRQDDLVAILLKVGLYQVAYLGLIVNYQYFLRAISISPLTRF